MGVVIEPISAAQRDAAIETLTRAFCDDPMYHALIPDPVARAPWVRFLMAGMVRAAGPRACFVGVDGGASAVLYATPSDHTSRWAGLAGLIPPLLRLPLDKLQWRRAAAVGRAVNRLLPPRPFLHLHLVAVDGAARGRGLGVALLRHALEVAARAPMPLHLETTNPDNLPFYRKLGLQLRDEVRAFEGAPPLWTFSTASVAEPPMTH